MNLGVKGMNRLMRTASKQGMEKIITVARKANWFCVLTCVRAFYSRPYCARLLFFQLSWVDWCSTSSHDANSIVTSEIGKTTMTVGCQPRTIFPREAVKNLIGDMEQIKNRWAQYFDELLNALTQPPYIEGAEGSTCPLTYTRRRKGCTKNTGKTTEHRVWMEYLQNYQR